MSTTFVVPLAQLHAHPENARVVATDVDDLASSMKQLGLLQPILVQSNGEGWKIVAGNRRVAAARALGWKEIDAREFILDAAIVASAAENMVRKPMHPVDAWRAVGAIMDKGVPLDAAAASLGLSDRQTRQMRWLSGMAPEVLDAFAAIKEDEDMPTDRTLRIVGNAPHVVQREALQAATSKEGIEWYRLTSGCNIRRINRSVAIFDVDQIQWDEDLFAEPGSDEQFSTSDVKTFLAKQKAALGARIAASKGRMIAGSIGKNHFDLVAPPGYTLVWDPIPKRWKKDDSRKHCVAVLEDGYQTGAILEKIAVPKPTKAAPLADDAQDTPRAREPITKAVQVHLASMKYAATVAALQTIPESVDIHSALRVLLLAIGADNLRLERNQQYAVNNQLREIAMKLLNDDGSRAVIAPQDLCAFAVQAVAEIIRFNHPATAYGTSGDAAEWVATEVVAVSHMQRCDTEEVLKGLSGDKLVELARARGIDDKGKVADVRRRLIGAMPDWSPVSFGAPLAYTFTAVNDDEEEEEGDGPPEAA